MTTASHRPLSPGMIALFGVAGAMLLGAVIAQATPTGMLDRTADDWRSRLPQTYSSLSYVAVGSTPESVEFGRRPLDPAMLGGEEPVLAQDHGPLPYSRTEPAPLEPVVIPDESATAVTVHRGSQSAKTAEASVEPQPAEPADPAATHDQAGLPGPAEAADLAAT